MKLLPFTMWTRPDYRANWHHRALAERLDRVAAGLCRRLMVFLPPQHGKSELVSRRFPAFVLGRDPDLRLIGSSHTNDLAIGMNRDVQRIMSGEAYGKLFPKSSLADRWVRGPEGILTRRTLGLFEIPGCRGGLRSAGVGKFIAGNAADGAIIDDPFGKREDADSRKRRERVWDWYANDLYSRLSAGAWIVLTHTRWHRDDLAGRLLRKMADCAADPWDVLCLPAVRGEGPGDPCDGRRRARPFGRPSSRPPIWRSSAARTPGPTPRSISRTRSRARWRSGRRRVSAIGCGLRRRSGRRSSRY